VWILKKRDMSQEESRVAKKIEEIRLLEVRREQREMENVEKRVKRTVRSYESCVTVSDGKSHTKFGWIKSEECTTRGLASFTKVKP
jgi:hypothetical protein